MHLRLAGEAILLPALPRTGLPRVQAAPDSDLEGHAIFFFPEMLALTPLVLKSVQKTLLPPPAPSSQKPSNSDLPSPRFRVCTACPGHAATWAGLREGPSSAAAAVFARGGFVVSRAVPFDSFQTCPGQRHSSWKTSSSWRQSWTCWRRSFRTQDQILSP